MSSIKIKEMDRRNAIINTIHFRFSIDVQPFHAKNLRCIVLRISVIQSFYKGCACNESAWKNIFIARRPNQADK